MLPVGAVLVDFDGTACLHDVAEHLLTAFGDASWPAYDAAVDRGEIGLREAIVAQASMLRVPTSELLAYATDHCPIDPTFPRFVGWLASHDVAVTVVSDGFGFYVRPLLGAAGLGELPVVTNAWVRRDGSPATLRFANGHPVCGGCGTCKMQAAVRARETSGPVAFVGDGQTDRYGALYSDVVFAKRDLVGYARADGVPFLPWADFDDVREALRHLDRPAGPIAPDRCPGWLPATP